MLQLAAADRQELNEVRAATACHPHALTRLIEECYGMRGRVKWELIKVATIFCKS